MSREGASIAARDRARRLQAALGEGATVLMGCTLVVLHQAPRRAIAGVPPANGGAAANDGGAGMTVTSLAGAQRGG